MAEMNGQDCMTYASRESSPCIHAMHNSSIVRRPLDSASTWKKSDDDSAHPPGAPYTVYKQLSARSNFRIRLTITCNARDSNLHLSSYIAWCSFRISTRLSVVRFDRLLSGIRLSG